MALESPDKAGPELGHLLSGRVLARSTIWNLADGTAPLAVAIVTIPIVLRGLGIDRFGVLTLAWALIGYFSLFDFGLGRALTQAVARAFAMGAQDDLPTIVWSGLGVMSVVGLMGGVVCIAVVPPVLEHALQIPASLRGETLGAAYIRVVAKVPWSLMRVARPPISAVTGSDLDYLDLLMRPVHQQ